MFVVIASEDDLGELVVKTSFSILGSLKAPHGGVVMSYRDCRWMVESNGKKFFLGRCC